jgi:hypothetical protein
LEKNWENVNFFVRNVTTESPKKKERIESLGTRDN